MDFISYQSEPADFESSTLEKHYQSKKSLAVAYLMTVGSKALTVADALQAESDPSLSILQTFDQETDIKRTIILDEAIRKFQLNITSYPGILLFKKGRNGTTRRIHLLMYQSNAGDFLVWKSKIVGQKVFKLSTLQSIETIQPQPLAESTVRNNGRYTGKSNLLSTAFIRLKNQKRSLDIQFYSAVDSASCVQYFTTKYLL
ncbi:unnamed protein product [Sphagnum jensenii]|uniref:Uncharacterized protein n=1 Tax=Sphagnum jensenii TaxID=128206 RepID=A0ABP0V9D2_9BRYO